MISTTTSRTGGPQAARRPSTAPIPTTALAPTGCGAPREIRRRGHARDDVWIDPAAAEPPGIAATAPPRQRPEVDIRRVIRPKGRIRGAARAARESHRGMLPGRSGAPEHLATRSLAGTRRTPADGPRPRRRPGCDAAEGWRTHGPPLIPIQALSPTCRSPRSWPHTSLLSSPTVLAAETASRVSFSSVMIDLSGFQASDDSPHAVECEVVEDAGAFVAPGASLSSTAPGAPSRGGTRRCPSCVRLAGGGPSSHGRRRFVPVGIFGDNRGRMLDTPAVARNGPPGRRQTGRGLFGRRARRPRARRPRPASPEGSERRCRERLLRMANEGGRKGW